MNKLIKVKCTLCNHEQRTKKNVRDTICSVCLKKKMKKTQQVDKND